MSMSKHLKKPCEITQICRIATARIVIAMTYDYK